MEEDGLLSQLRPRAAAEDLTERLRSMIHRGELGPGDCLPSERQLATQLSVGRITVRRALQVLQAEGYLSARRGRGGGSFVTDLTVPRERWLHYLRDRLDEMDDVFEVRIALERRTTMLACRRRGRADLAAMRGALDQMARASGLHGFRAADTAFHGAVAAAARSAQLARAVSTVRGRLFLPTDALVYPPDVERAREGHEAIFAAISGRRERRAADLMEEHVEDTRAWLHHTLLSGG